MTEPPKELFGRWIHSFEEDTPGVAVHRPPDFAFPPARGRRGLEFAADGTFVDHPIGRGDAPDTFRGVWHSDDGRRFTVSFPGTARPGRTLEVLFCDGRVLKLKA